jgi:hypothetical protein
MAERGEREGVCGGAPPALVTRGGRTVFARSGRTPQQVLQALHAGRPVDEREAELAQAWLERHGRADAEGGLP